MTNKESLDETSLTTDLFCVACDYNLRGLKPSGRCPECGQRIVASLGSKAPPAKWSRRVCMGLWLCLAAALVDGATGTGLLLLWPDGRYRLGEYHAFWLFRFFGILGLQWLAIWVVAAATQRGLGHRPMLILLVRAAPVIMLAYDIEWMCVLDYVSESRLQWLFPWEALGAIAIVAALGQWLVVVCRCHHWRRPGVLARAWQITVSAMIALECGTYLYAWRIHHMLTIPVRTPGFRTSISVFALMQDVASVVLFAVLAVVATRELQQRRKALREWS